jgi:hypothetical protein
MRIIDRILRRGPKGYDRPVKIRYDRALVFEGYSGTADKLFTKERTPLPPLIFHVFVFALDATECEIWVKDDAKTSFVRGRLYRAHLNADRTYCLFNGDEAVVRRREPDHEEEDEASGA